MQEALSDGNNLMENYTGLRVTSLICSILQIAGFFCLFLTLREDSPCGLLIFSNIIMGVGGLAAVVKLCVFVAYKYKTAFVINVVAGIAGMGLFFIAIMNLIEIM